MESEPSDSLAPSAGVDVAADVPASAVAVAPTGRIEASGVVVGADVPSWGERLAFFQPRP